MRELLQAVLLSMPLVGVFAIFAIGIVLIYRASKVLNLAHGFMATAPAFLLVTLSVDLGVPRYLGFVLAILAGGGLGWLVERQFVRPFRAQGASAQTVGTVVVLALGIALMARIWGTGSVTAVPIFPEGFVAVGGATVQYGAIGLFVTMLGIFAGLAALFRFTDLGLLLRASAENPAAASLMGVNPQRMTALTWFIGGALAGVAGILLSAITTISAYTTPLQALGGFLAALIGGLESVAGALVGAFVVGILLGAIPLVPVISEVPGIAQLLLTLVGFAAMAARGRTLVGAS
jgi:branched-chain amino acid transport system permease protein